jgi:Domain of unknown function (DUF4157)
MATFVSLQRRSANSDQTTRLLDGRKSASPTTRSSQERSSAPDWNFARISVRPAATSIQTKLIINQPGDQYEQEADHVADQVFGMSAPSAAVPVKGNASPAIQRACACGGTCDKCKEDEHEHIQRKPAPSGNTAPAAAPPIVNDVLSSPGQPLDSATRTFMEPRFGCDFGCVRIHADDKAAASAQALGARAYTLGRHIVFGRAESSPADPAARQLMAHELTHVIQQQAASESATIMRAPEKDKPAPPPPPTPCTINCTDPAFMALSPDDRAKRFDSQCPQGYPLDTTFFGQPIPGESSKKLHDKLLAAASRAKRLMCINGKDPNAYTLDRRVGTYAHHSPSQSQAVDIDYEGQTYILHEAYKFKEQVEDQLSPVYNRIAFWTLGAKSIIPSAIKTVDRPTRGDPDARTWRNPATGKVEPITTGDLYDKLKAESDAMTQYFDLLNKSDADLQTLMQAFVTQHTADEEAVKKLGLPFDSQQADVDKFRVRIASDYRLLGGSRAQLKAFAGQGALNVSKAPPTVKDEENKDVDLARPFRGGTTAGAMSGGQPDPAQNRRPELGFVTLPKEVVVALTQESLVWGAIDFGGGAGDVMHFDCRRGVC